MSSSDFRQIARTGSTDRAERLFRAAISAYCSLSHPTRAETAQLEDLAIPLYSSVSEEGLRYVAAALSECPAPPRSLVLRLCMERVDLSAPLIVRTTVLSDADLISLIARCGGSHASVVARRKNLNPAIAALISQISMRTNPANDQPSQAASPAPMVVAETAPEPAATGDKAEKTRDQLRGMMAPSRATTAGVIPIHVYPQLRAAALNGERDRLAAVLVQSLGLDPETALALLRPASVPLLVTAMRALALTGEQALLIVASVAPVWFTRPNAARELVSNFASESIEGARKQVLSFEREDRQSADFARDISRAALARSA